MKSCTRPFGLRRIARDYYCHFDNIDVPNLDEICSARPHAVHHNIGLVIFVDIASMQCIIFASAFGERRYRCLPTLTKCLDLTPLYFVLPR